MTTTAIDMPFGKMRLGPTEGVWKVDDPSRLEEALAGSRDGFVRLGQLQSGGALSSSVPAVDPATAGVPQASDIVLQFTRTMQEQCRPAPVSEEFAPFGIEVELPPWKGPDPIPVQVIVQSVKRGTFRPITDDDFGGI